MSEFESAAQEWAAQDESAGALGRHSVLLISLIGLLVALPLGQVVAAGDALFSVLLSVVLVAAVIVNQPSKRSALLTLVVGVLAVLGLGFAAVTGSVLAQTVANLLSLTLLSLTTLFMIASLIFAQRVSLDTVVGGICVYLLIGLCFSMVFGLLCGFFPGALSEAGVPIERSINEQGEFATKLLYFSFVTLTTLGYGDIRPVSEIAQMMAAGEAVTGQLYLAIFIARLVALYVAQGAQKAFLRDRD